MTCPHCHSEEISRISRKTFWERVKASVGLWPYVCESCFRQFSSRHRNPPARTRTAQSPFRTAKKPENQTSGPAMAFRNDPVRPLAKVVIEADDQAQLDQILMALNRAVSYYQKPVRDHTRAGQR